MRGKNLEKTILFKVFFRNYLLNHGDKVYFLSSESIFSQILFAFSSNMLILQFK